MASNALREAVPNFCSRKKIGRRFEASAHVELRRVELAVWLGLRAGHEEAFLDDLAVPDLVKPDLIEVHAFLALGGHI